MTAKRKQETCNCPAYPFPHRKDSGKCGKVERCYHGIAREYETCLECEDNVRRWMNTTSSDGERRKR